MKQLSNGNSKILKMIRNSVHSVKRFLNQFVRHFDMVQYKNITETLPNMKEMFTKFGYDDFSLASKIIKKQMRYLLKPMISKSNRSVFPKIYWKQKTTLFQAFFS